MHRVGHLWEQMIASQNCTNAVLEMLKNKPIKNRHIEDPVQYGEMVRAHIIEGYQFHPYREKTIKDSYKGKDRNLKIPCKQDQVAMQTWLLIAIPHIVRRNYYYNCGSIPGAGQKRAVLALSHWLNARKPEKWAASLDIKKFYDNCPHALAIHGLRKIFKDEKFIGFAAKMLAAMNDNGVGLAIGFPVSHWFANVALMELDHRIKDSYKVRLVRYMDDIIMISANKRVLRGAVQCVADYLTNWNMQLKHTWQIYQIQHRGILFLSYRFFHHYTLLAKPLMFRIARRAKKAGRHLTLAMARAMVSYKGVLKYCNSMNFRTNRIYRYISFRSCQRMISEAT